MTAYRAAADLRAEPLDELTAFYHRASGTTHLVVSPVPEILAALAQGATRDALLTALSADFDVAQPEAIDARLEELVAAGLVATA